MDVIIYVMDALRRDFTGPYGGEAEITPNLNSFTDEDNVTVFERAYSTSTWTFPAAVSLLTGQYPGTMGTMSQFDELGNYPHTIQNVLGEHEVESTLISASPWVSPIFGIDGFDCHESLFEDEDIIQKRRVHMAGGNSDGGNEKLLSKADLSELVVPTSADINRRMSEVLESTAGTDLFAVCWSMDTHGPFFVRGNKSRFGNSLDQFIPSEVFQSFRTEKQLNNLCQLYKDMVWYNDSRFGTLIEELQMRGRYQNSLIIVLGDHGEMFGEHTTRKPLRKHPVIGHGGPPYEQVINIPLLVKYPSGPRPNRDNKRRQLHDIMPTVLEQSGISISTLESDLAGKPLSGPGHRVVFTESKFTSDHPHRMSIERNGWKLLVSSSDEYDGAWYKRPIVNLYRSLFVEDTSLYDMDNKGEHSDVGDRYPRKRADLLEECKRLHHEHHKRQNELTASTKAQVDEAVEQRLAGFGYLGE